MDVAAPVSDSLDPMFPYTQYYDLANYNIDTFVKIRSVKGTFLCLVLTYLCACAADIAFVITVLMLFIGQTQWEAVSPFAHVGHF